jgi:hypothetical protein
MGLEEERNQKKYVGISYSLIRNPLIAKAQIVARTRRELGNCISHSVHGAQKIGVGNVDEFQTNQITPKENVGLDALTRHAKEESEQPRHSFWGTSRVTYDGRGTEYFIVYARYVYSLPGVGKGGMHAATRSHHVHIE